MVFSKTFAHIVVEQFWPIVFSVKLAYWLLLAFVYAQLSLSPTTAFQSG